MFLHFIIPPACLLGLSFLIIPRTVSGQAPGSDSAAPAAISDSQPLADSLARDTLAAGTPRATADTGVQRAGPDTSGAGPRAASDTAPKQERPDTAKTEAAAASEPGDTILRRSCRDPAGAGVASDLLVVVFAPQAVAEERAAAAKSVNGTLLGSVPGDPGGYYLRVPSDGEEYRLRAAADELIQMAQVRQVGSRSCPPS